MAIIEILVVVLGLCLFEIISSIDNAIINASVLKTLPEKFRKFFLFWGLLVAVFAVRGVLPFLIVWLANPNFSLFFNKSKSHLSFISGYRVSRFFYSLTPGLGFAKLKQ